MKKIILGAFLAFLILTCSCGTLIKTPVEISDSDLYYLKEASDSEYALHTRFFSGKSDQVSKEAWDKGSQNMVCMPLSSFSDFNIEIGKLCSQVPCNYKDAPK